MLVVVILIMAILIAGFVMLGVGVFLSIRSAFKNRNRK